MGSSFWLKNTLVLKMLKKTQAILENFRDKEILYMLQYAQAHLETNEYKPDDGTLQGDILKRLYKVIQGIK
jgi:hypothetical protein